MNHVLRTAGLAAAILSLTLGVRGTASAVVSASASAPLRADIDGACAAPLAAADASPTQHGALLVVLLKRVAQTSAGYGPWWDVGTDPNGVPKAAPPPLKSELVVAVADHGALAFARDTTADASGDGATVHEFCYRGEKLVRATTTIDDVSEGIVYSRVVYYGDSGDPIADSGQQAKILSRGAAVQQLPPSSLAIPPYASPASQPFFAALQAALARRA